MQTEPREFGTIAAAKLGRGFARISSQFRSSRGRSLSTCSPGMLDEAFAVFSRIDEGGTVPNQHTAPPAKNGRANLQSAARDLAASISAQLDSIIDNVTSSNACCR